MLPYQERVIEELAQLMTKCESLEEFFSSPTYAKLPLQDQELLQEQYKCMSIYCNILGERIQRFNLPSN